MRQLCTHPVEHRHEVVAKYTHPSAPHVANALAIVFDESVARRPAKLDVLVHGNTFDHLEGHPMVFDLGAQARESIERPRLPDRNVE